MSILHATLLDGPWKGKPLRVAMAHQALVASGYSWKEARKIALDAYKAERSAAPIGEKAKMLPSSAPQTS